MKFLLKLIAISTLAIALKANTDSANYKSKLILHEILYDFNIKNTKENMDILSSIQDSIKDRDLRDFKTIIQNSPENVSIVQNELANIEAPYFLLYLAMVESKFLNRATSNMRAGGMWQFMPSTARAFGLRVNKDVDERRDPFASTDTAFEYLDFLNAQFNKWYVSLMAYNCGDGCMRKVIRHGDSDDFSTILLSSKTPKETKNFIKRIIKYSIISKREDSKQLLSSLESRYKLEKVMVKPGTKLYSVSNSINLDLKIMQQYNLHIKNGEAPRGSEGYYFYIPEDKLELYALNYIGKVIKDEKNSSKFQTYKVAKNDTLSSIANRLGTTIKELKAANNLKNSFIKVDQELKIPVASFEPQKYKVKKGDTLLALASKFNVDKKDIIKNNNIKNQILVAGDTIVIP
ncbi:membrane-bound lytic murein transglycosylase D [Campylobacter blaseri]|uniref:Lytic transglycosylase n=1 Tax=Campylobacter blaseri TaxID=2042961 RepID=A0A2P8R016_9BACT|nr:lytic transglycosylase domain-containing protein [Campylobacter blaseri]PSM51830.1 lytic transglycosylase [Campylobacter blaseri]PSM53621.1 lytic transglycosylase [Campylobacter blaseri]QKF86436.1 membrane-bound lytic murein transglycosylase D [Campylobacter blaseri]